MRLQRYKEKGLSDVTTFTADAGLSWTDTAGRSFTLPMKELKDWRGNRADAGRIAPKGFPKNNKFRSLPSNGKAAAAEAKPTIRTNCGRSFVMPGACAGHPRLRALWRGKTWLARDKPGHDDAAEASSSARDGMEQSANALISRAARRPCCRS